MLSADRERRVEELFHAALAQPAAERADFVARGASGDAEVANEVLSLLGVHREHDAELEAPAVPAAIPQSLAGRRLGPYRVLRELGRGGMGVVLLAERTDGAFDRLVAIKVVQSASAWSPERRRELELRFLAERRVLAALDHPHIARLLDAGATDEGEPYLVMEFVDGTPIDRFCRENKPDLRARLGLFREVCLAVDAAHQRLVAHRDLKPANVLVTTHAGRPEPKLLDFGIAKLLDDADGGEATRTTLGSARLTPAYASPEQFRGEPASIASDVYSLGVVLYELVTGRLPYEVARATPEAMMLAVLNEVPLAPRRIDRRIAADLETIVLKALEKEPARRYASAAAFAGDLQRFVEGRPIDARRATAAYRFAKLVQRHKLVSALGAGAAACLIALGVWSLVLRKASVEAREVADRERTSAATATALFREIFTAPQPYERLGKDVTVLQVLDDVAPRVLAKLTHEPRVRFDLEGMLADTYLALGAPLQAEPHAEAAAASSRELFARADERRLTAHNRWFRALTGVARAAEAAELAQAELDALPAGVPRELELDLRAALCLALREIGEDERAEELARELVDASRELRGEYDAKTLSHVVDLSSILIDHLRYAEAEELLRATLDGAPDDPALEQALSALRFNLGFSLHRTGALDEARPLLESVYAARAERLGDEHVETTKPLHELADMDATLGDHAAALEKLERVGRALTKHLGADHPDTLAVEISMAYAISELGEPARALCELDAAYQRSRETNGEEHYITGALGGHLVMFLSGRGAVGEAIELQRRVIEAERRAREPDDPVLAQIQNNLATLLRGAGELAEAERVQLEALEHQERALGVAHPSSIVFRANLGAIRRARGDWLGAREAYEAAIENGDGALGVDNGLLGGCHEGAARLAGMVGDWTSAECHLTRAHELYAELLGESHPATRAQLESLASVLERAGHADRAAACRERLADSR